MAVFRTNFGMSYDRIYMGSILLPSHVERFQAFNLTLFVKQIARPQKAFGL
jgi:hypothetical protein